MTRVPGRVSGNAILGTRVPRKNIRKVVGGWGVRWVEERKSDKDEEKGEDHEELV